MTSTARIRSFPYVAKPSAKILILGTMPGATALANQEYYAYRPNKFWRIITAFIGVSWPELGPKPKEGDDLEYKAFIAKMKREVVKHNIAIWDVLQSCHRPGSSLDSKIKNVTPNDFAAFFAKHKKITDVFFNGTPASQFFKRHVNLPDTVTTRLTFHIMPSTSPARAMKEGAKEKIWLKELSKTHKIKG